MRGTEVITKNIKNLNRENLIQAEKYKQKGARNQIHGFSFPYYLTTIIAIHYICKILRLRNKMINRRR